MTNSEKYSKAFIEAFNVSESELADLEYQSIARWDSIGHMNLVAILEEAFEIMMDTDDIIDFSSFKKGKEIIGKYDVEL